MPCSWIGPVSCGWEPTNTACFASARRRCGCSGSLWVGGEVAAYRLRPSDQLSDQPGGPFERYAHRGRDPFSLGRGRIPSFLHAADGSFWIGAWEGGVAWTHTAFARIHSLTLENDRLQPLSDPRLLAVAHEGESFWLGTGDGVAHYDLASGRVERLPGTEGRVVYTLLVEPEQLWLGTDLGLYRYSRLNNTLSSELLDPELDRVRIRRLLRDGDRLWVFAELVGLHVIDLQRQQSIQRHRFVGNVYHIGILDAERMLVSASDGLHWFSRDGLSRLHQRAAGQGRPPAQLPAPISGFARDSQQRVWLSSYGAGAFELLEPRAGDASSAEFRPIPRLKALTNRAVNSLQIDAQDRLWLASDRGVSLFDPATLEVRNLDDVDGALVRGYYFSSADQTPTGRVALGSKEGLSLIDTRQTIESSKPPAPLLIGLSVANRWQQVQWRMADSVLEQPAHLVERIALPPGKGRSFGFRFASPTFTEGRRLRYHYRLLGFDQDWLLLEPGRREAGYTNLPPGRYQLQMFAESGWGERSETSRIDIDIAAFWWQTWWSIALAVLALILLVILAVRWRLSRLRRARIQLEMEVKERTRDLLLAREQAERSLRELQVTQEELIRSEKLSALGGLVASVAHEVNTPLGVALTASSHLADRVRRLDQAYQSGHMARSDLIGFIESAKEGSEMVERNLQRAASLIGSFKRVSADRSSDERRRFNLAQMLEELLQSLKLLWKRRSIEVQIECSPDIEMNSYPGALGQVLTNLAQNAVVHAFAGRDTGVIRIEAMQRSDQLVEIRFSDDGLGIAQEHLGHLFEPFFTTRR